MTEESSPLIGHAALTTGLIGFFMPVGALGCLWTKDRRVSASGALSWSEVLLTATGAGGSGPCFSCWLASEQLTVALTQETNALCLHAEERSGFCPHSGKDDVPLFSSIHRS